MPTQTYLSLPVYHIGDRIRRLVAQGLPFLGRRLACLSAAAQRAALQIPQVMVWNTMRPLQTRQNKRQASQHSFICEMLVERNRCMMHCTIDANHFTSLLSTITAGSKSCGAVTVSMLVIILLPKPLELIVKRHDGMQSAESCSDIIAGEVFKMNLT